MVCRRKCEPLPSWGYLVVRFLRVFLREIEQYLHPVSRIEIYWKLELMQPEYPGLDLGTDVGRYI
jgi:hypothetical protein